MVAVVHRSPIIITGATKTCHAKSLKRPMNIIVVVQVGRRIEAVQLINWSVPVATTLTFGVGCPFVTLNVW